MTTAVDTRLSIAAHRDFPGNLLDGAMPNGDSGVLIASGLSDFSGALMAAERDNSEVLLAFTPTVPDVLELLIQSRKSRPDMGLVVAIPGPANGSLGEALVAGAHEIVILPAERTVVAAAVQKAMARVSTAAKIEATTDTRCPLVVVLGPKGGVGKTTVATNLATTLAAKGHRTLLVDIDLQFGDVGLVLGIQPDRTIHDLVTAQGHLDGERLRGFVSQTVDGVDVLLAPARPDQADAVTAEKLTAVLDTARAEYDVVIVDTPPAFTSTTITAIDHAQHVVMVGTLDLPGLKNMKVGLETLALMGFDRDRIVTVLNRADSKVGLIAHDVKKILAASPDINVPSDRSVPRSLNATRAIIASEPKAAPAKALRALGERVAAAIFKPDEKGG
ncbi:MAG TPA: AAA family ATPase [Gaiellales bacterium]|nr:AAA family ATPase [Gaiellales bacterium]